MCTSRLHRVLEVAGPSTVLVEDMDGARHQVSLLALDPPEPVPAPGEWLVVHTGFAIDRVDAAEAESVLADLRAAGLHPLIDAGPVS